MVDKNRLRRKPEGIARTAQRLLGINPVRTAVQATFLALVMGIGWEFWAFVDFHQRSLPGTSPGRPPGVEGFLPISGLMGLKDWVLNGSLNVFHPAATVLLAIFILLSWLLRKSFCSWICPVGAISEYLWKIGRRVFGRNLLLPRWLDVPLRSLKYALLALFLYAVLWMMDESAIRSFIESPYNRVADVKMLFFFTRISTFSLKTLVVLGLLSVVVRNFWCRYLCPYGALLGIFGGVGATSIRRSPDACIDCGKCAKACPAELPVDKLLKVRSVECTGCLDCVAVCPVTETLEVYTVPVRKPWSIRAFAAAVVLVFLLGVGLARLTGHWQNAIAPDEYRKRMQEIDSPEYTHPGGGGR